MTVRKLHKPIKDKVIDEYPLEIKHVAQILCVHINTVYRLVNRGGIKQIWIGGKCRFKKEWVDEYLESRTYDPKRHGRSKK